MNTATVRTMYIAALVGLVSLVAPMQASAEGRGYGFLNDYSHSYERNLERQQYRQYSRNRYSRNRHHRSLSRSHRRHLSQSHRRHEYNYGHRYGHGGRYLGHSRRGIGLSLHFGSSRSRGYGSRYRYRR